MTEIYISFNQWSEDKLRQEEKIGTSRNQKCGKPLDFFKVKLGRKYGIYVYELLTITRKTLQEVAKNHYEAEGCNSPEHYISVWEAIHPVAGWQPEKKVWYHEFRLIRKLNQTKGAFNE